LGTRLSALVKRPEAGSYHLALKKYNPSWLSLICPVKWRCVGVVPSEYRVSPHGL
jgi:hypothetical protein